MESTKFQCFLSYLEKSEFKTSNAKMKEVINRYTFIDISKKNKSEINLDIIDNMKESKVIIISHYKEQKEEKEDLYFVLSFKRTIMVINKIRYLMLQSLLLEKGKVGICFLADTKKIFDDINDQFSDKKIEYDEIKNNENFKNEINSINFSFFDKKPENFPFDDILQTIKSSISGYLIKQSYCAYDRINNFNEKIKPTKITEDEVIELRTFGIGSVFNSVLYYHIEYEKLVIIKKNISSDPEIKKLLKREIENYKRINYPFIPKFYGIFQDDDFSYPVIEFINGKNLGNTDFYKFSNSEKYEIIIQLLLVINYLHNNKLIYRDLKPNNVMIDENKNLVLIDYDRMVKDDYIYNENEKTAEFPSPFAAPEIKPYISYPKITYKCDIYSIGKMIEFLFIDKKTMMKNYEYTRVIQIYKECTQKKVDLRPKSSELINDFLFFFRENNKACCLLQNRIINKIIYYHSLAANQNIPQAQYNLGNIYYIYK